jgi:Tol biopolymer transport system component
MTDTPNESESFPEWSPDGTTLLYMMQGDLYLRDMVDQSIRQITQSGVNEEYAVWSPDSSQIIFQVAEHSDNQRYLYHVTVTSGQIRMLETTIPPRAQPISWSPDSQYITLTLDTQQVIILNVASGTIHTLTDGTQRTSSTAWSPDGRFIAYIENRHIQLYNLSHSKTLRLDLEMTVLPPLIWKP